MRILYDGRIFQMQRAGGINRYFAEVISGLPDTYQPVVCGVENFGENSPCHPNLKRSYFKPFWPGRISRRVRNLRWKPQLLAAVDILHPTYYDFTEGLALEDFRCRVVLTVHDFIFAVYPELLPDAPRVIHHQTMAIERADHLICISRATENDLLERFPHKKGMTSVIYHGSSFPIQELLRAEDIFERPYFLYVGSRAGYKNFQFLLRVFARVSQEDRRVRLKIAGAPLSFEEKWTIHLLGLDDRVDLVEYPNEKRLLDLYRSSVALLYPSLYEGFGIPPLEAMACGTVAITSNTTSLPEVVGDGGVMLDPRDETVWIECLLKALEGGAERQRLLERGRKRVAEFSWKETAAQHLAIYQRLAA